MESFSFGNADEVKAIVIYDITSNKRRYKMVRELEGYGKRVQKSAFECNITALGFRKLLGRIPKLITEDDSVRIYVISNITDMYTWDSNGFTEAKDVLIC